MHDEPPLARRELIATRLATGHAVVAAALAHEFDVSEDAIRRDLRALAVDGRCRRVYGGALPISAASATMADRVDVGRARKTALALAAKSSIQPRELLFLDSGSTNLALTPLLPEEYELTIATNSVDIAAAVLRRPDLKLIMIGGPVDPLVGGCVDGAAVQSIQQLNIDRCFLGVCSVSAATGVSVFHSSDATFKRALLGVSEHSVALVTSDKFDARASHRVAPLARFETFVVEHDAPSSILDEITRTGAAVLRADPT